MIQCCCGITQETGFDWWNLFEMLIPVAITFIAGFLAYRYAIKQLHKTHELALKQVQGETPLLIEREKYNRILSSLQGSWKLLIYMTDTENEKSILTFLVKKDKSKTYYINISNANAFIKALPDYFYDSGLGLYLPVEIRALLFEYRNLIYGFLLVTKVSTEDSVEIKNEAMSKRMIEIYKELIKLLREKLELERPEMP